MIPTMWHCEKDKDSKNINGYQVLGEEEGLNRWKIEDFRAVNDTVMVNMYHYIFSKPVESNIQRGTLM